MGVWCSFDTCSSSSPSLTPSCHSTDKSFKSETMSEMSYHATLLHTVTSHTSDINGVAFSKTTLATCGGDKTVRLWSLRDFSELPCSPLHEHTYSVNGCVFSPTNSSLVSYSTDGKAVLWDIQTGQKLALFQHKSQCSIKVCRFSPNGELLVTGSDDETLCLWDIRTRKMIRSFEGVEASIPAAAFSPDSAYIVSGSSNGDLRIWDAKYGHGRHLVYLLDGHDLGVMCCEFSPTYGSAGDVDRTCATMTHFLLATGGYDNIVRLWDVVANAGSPNVELRLRNVLSGHGGAIMALTFAPDGKLLASAGGDKTVVLWDPHAGVQLHTISGHTRFVTCCAFSVDGTLLASGSNDRHVMVWHVGNDNLLDQPRQPEVEGSKREDIAGPQKTPAAPPTYSGATKWSVDEVSTWLAELGLLEEYGERFQSNHIDGRELLSLTQETMEKDLGMTALGHRNKLQRAIQILRDDVGSGTPDEFLCPITREIMRDPVIASDGHTYERYAIIDWIRRGKLDSPMTNACLSNATLTPNYSLKMLIQRHLAQQ